MSQSPEAGPANERSVKPTAPDRFAKELLALLEETFETHHGIFLDEDTSMFQILDGLSAEQASRAAGPGRPTIAAHAEHVRFYLEVIERYMLGTLSGPVDWKEIWRTTSKVSPDRWDEIRARLRSGYDRALRLLRERNWDGEDDIGGALAMLAHSAYHLGQIVMTVRMVAPPPRG